MNLNVLHRRLLQDVLEIGNSLPLVITGGYAVQAHHIVDRFSRDIDMATDSTVAMETILIDIHAASRLRTTAELEILGRRHAWEDEFSLQDLKFRLDDADWYDDQAFAEYGLTDQEISNLRRWAQSWSDDINRRLYAETYVDDEDEELP